MKSIGHQFAAGFALLGAAAIIAIGAITTNQEMAAAAITPDMGAVQTISTPAGGSTGEHHFLYGR
ncbi:hypothetical protein L2K20_23195 [Mycobacterium sp. MBM]|nr:hypothetical protein [Mycobacterium sp. MBM]